MCHWCSVVFGFCFASESLIIPMPLLGFLILNDGTLLCCLGFAIIFIFLWGGNRHGKVKTYFVLMATMLLGGLWHGANWTFVAWEGLHGIYLWIERYLKDKRSAAHIHKEPSDAIEVRCHPWISFFYALLTFMLINITWVFFRADTFGKSWQLLQSMFGLVRDGKALLTTLAILKVSIIIPILV